jgi:hypothetical protein
MGMSFAAMWLISMYQMWIYKVPAVISNEEGQLPTLGS